MADKETVSFTIDEFYLDLQSDGKTINRLPQERIEKNPFPGLRPFRTSEFPLFKGRDSQVQEVLEKLDKQNFLAVIGSSGTGKSSLVRAGLIPQLFGGFLYRAGIIWDIAICRPGDDPINNLAVAFSSLKCNSNEKSVIAEEYGLIHPLLLKSTYGILNVNNILERKNKNVNNILEQENKNVNIPEQENKNVNILEQENKNVNIPEQENKNVNIPEQENENVNIPEQENVNILEQENANVNILEQEDENVNTLERENENVDTLRQENENVKRNLLVIIDQFEELFRYDQKKSTLDNVQNYFVNLLLNAAANKDNRTYVIITMRSEFLGNAVKFKGLPEAINAGQYLVPQLNNKQLREVIEGPVLRAKKTIDPTLIQLLINEIEQSMPEDENLDYLPILQHALMRTYEHAVGYKKKDLLEIVDYDEIGQMKNALSNHAESLFIHLDNAAESKRIATKGVLPEKSYDLEDESWFNKKQKIGKMLFQALTDNTTDLKGGRRPTELENIYAIAGAKPLEATHDEVDEVINDFRGEDTSFIMPASNIALYPKLKLDISHESLMRNWPRLKKWMADEVKYGKLYKTLNERREMREAGQDDWVKAGLLDDMIKWKTNFPHSPAWASRYHTIDKDAKNAYYLNEIIFKKNLDYLDESILQRDAEKKQEKIKVAITIAAIFLLILTGVSILMIKRQVKTSNLAFSLAGISKIDTIPNDTIALKAAIQAYTDIVNGVSNPHKDSANNRLIGDGLNVTENKIKSIFRKNAFNANLIGIKGYQVSSASIFDNDSLILVSYSLPVLSPITSFDTVSFGRQAPMGAVKPKSGAGKPGPKNISVLYDADGKRLNKETLVNPTYHVENSNLIAVNLGYCINIYKEDHGIKWVNTISLINNEVRSRKIASIIFNQKYNLLLINRDSLDVTLCDLNKRTVNFLNLTRDVGNKANRNAEVIKGDFLKDGNILLNSQNISYSSYKIPTNSLQIYYRDLDYKKGSQVYKYPQSLLGDKAVYVASGSVYSRPSYINVPMFSGDNAYFLLNTNNGLYYYDPRSRRGTKDPELKKLIKISHQTEIIFNDDNSFALYNDSLLQVYDDTFKSKTLKAPKANQYIKVLDFKKNTILISCTEKNRLTDTSLVYLIDVKTGESRLLPLKESDDFYNFRLSNNADLISTHSLTPGYSLGYNYSIYSINNFEHPLIKIQITSVRQDNNSFFPVVLDKNYQHSSEDLTGNVGGGFAFIVYNIANLKAPVDESLKRIILWAPQPTDKEKAYFKQVFYKKTIWEDFVDMF